MRVFSCLFALFLIAACWIYVPAASTDLGSLIPVETLCVEREKGRIVVNGSGVRGEGTDWASAMEDLEASAEGTVFLETADRVVVSVSARDCMENILRDERLRPAVQLYWLRGDAEGNLEAFTSAHESTATIAECRKIPVIIEEHGRYRLG